MPFTPYFYRDEQDLTRIQNALAHWIHIAGNDCGYVHVGDIPHHLFNGQRCRYNPREIVRIWQDDSGDIQGFVLVLPRFNNYEAFVHPQHRGSELENELLHWGEQETLNWLKREDKFDKTELLRVEVDDCDETRQKLLKQRGYKPAKPFLAVTQRPLSEPLPEISLPNGFTIRAAKGIQEADKLAQVHSNSFNSGWTTESYQQVMESPGYAAEREIIIVAPDGQFAAFCIIWFDTLNKTGYFEPVGTHKVYRRKGLARALMLWSMRHMQTHGLETAVVCHEVGNPGSTALYASLGFRPVLQVLDFTKPLKPS